MSPEIKAAIIYFAIVFLAGCAMIVQGYNLHKNKLDSLNSITESKGNLGPIFMFVGALMITSQAYELYEQLI
jgi:hypothetical protein